MHETLQKQMGDTSSVIRQVIENIDFSAPENILIATASQENVLNGLIKMLEDRKQELLDDMHRSVLEYSAKIATTNNLINSFARQAERQMVLRERIEAGEPT